MAFTTEIVLLFLMIFIAETQCHDRVIGGIETVPHSDPYIVHLDTTSSFFCGGSLIDNEWVLSAAHCYMDSFTVELGDHDQSKTENTEQSIQPSKVFLHPRYSTTTKDYDVMLIKLSTPAIINQYVKTINIPAAYDELSAGVKCRLCGWGNLQTSGNVYPDVLQCITVNVVSNQDCNKPIAYDGLVTDNMLCTYSTQGGGQDACDGDSGGPVVCDNLLHGVVSWGYGCAYPDFPGVNSKVSWSTTWIHSVINYN